MNARLCPTRFALRARAAALLAALLCAAATTVALSDEASAQDVPSDIRAGAPPLVLLLLDTSGSMEFLEQDDTFPCCVYDAANTAYEQVCNADNQCQPHQSCVGGRCSPQACSPVLSSTSPQTLLGSGWSFPKSRSVQAKEVLAGRWDGYWCQEVPRANGDAFTLDDTNYPLPHFEPRGADQYRESGLLFLNRDFVRFGYFPFDSLRDDGDLWSYPTNAGGWENASWNLGVRSDRAPVGPAVWVGPLNDPREGLRRAELIERSVAEFIPYGATPLGPMLADINDYLKNDPDIVNDPFKDCRRKEIVLITDGAPTLDDCAVLCHPDFTAAPAATCPSYCVEGGMRYPYRPTLMEAAELMRDHDDVRIHVVGSNVAPEDAIPCQASNRVTPVDDSAEDNDAAKFGSVACVHQLAILGETDADRGDDETSAYIADGQLELTRDLTRVLNSIVDGISARTATRATTRVEFRDDRAGQYQFSAAFELDDTHHLWRGRLERATFDCNGILGDVTNFGDVLNARDPATRTIFTVFRNRTLNLGDVSRMYFEEGDDRLIRFTQPNLSARVTGLSQAELNDRFRANILPGVGFNTVVGLIKGSDPDRADRKLGGIFHASPVIVGGPELVLDIPGYERFAQAVNPVDQPRVTAIAQGSKDGLLHYFNAFNGEELWAFMPEELQSKAYLQKATHIYGVDAAPIVRDVRLYRGEDDPPEGYIDPVTDSDAVQFNDIWATTLVGGLRAGGRAFYALDVSYPERPRFLWELNPDTERVHVRNLNAGREPLFVANDASIIEPVLGLSYGEPGVGTVLYEEANKITERGVAILAGGLPSDPDNVEEGRAIFVVELATGRIIRRFLEAKYEGEGFRRIKAPVTGSVAVYSDFPGTFITRAFVGDARGRLYRVDMRYPDPARWYVEEFHDSGSDRAIYLKPTTATGPNGEVVVLYGTGDVDNLELREQDNRVFSLREEIVFNANGTINDGNIRARENWVLNLERGEKLTGSPTIFDRTAYFATFKPDEAEICSFGNARIYAVDFFGDNPGRTDDIIGQFGDEDVNNNPDAILTLNPDDTFIDLEENSVVFGLEIAARPSCTPDTPDDLDDPSTDPGSVAQNNPNADLELVAQTGRSQSTTALPGNASRINKVRFKLQRPPTAAFETAWAKVLN